MAHFECHPSFQIASKVFEPMKVFWSWQSDSPRKTNKEFIRDVLSELCSELKLSEQIEPADRPENESEDIDEEGHLTVDYDTEGVGGHPPIASTILDKISEAAVFAGDITPIVKTTGGKLIPNPNVMLELGYAIAKLGYDRLLLFVNTAAAVDGTRLKNLPFDLTHCRHPYTYSLTKDSDDESIARVAADLKAKVKESLRLSLLAAAAAKRANSKSPTLRLVAMPDRKSIASLSIAQIANISSVKSVTEIQREAPLEPLPPAQQSSMLGNRLSTSQHLRSLGVTPPISQWSREEVERYNQDLTRYYKDWANHILAVEQWSLASQRQTSLEFLLINDGKSPATNIDIELIFPSNVEIMYEDEVLDYPVAPRRPEKRPRASNEAFGYVVDTVDFLPINRIAYDAEIRKPDNIVRFYREDLKHQCETALGKFKIRFVRPEDLYSFDVRYIISKNEPGPHFEGLVTFDVEVA